VQTLYVTYATIRTILNTVPTYYVTQGDGGYDLFVVGDETFIRSTIAGDATSDKSDFETNYKTAATSTASADDARVLGTVANHIPLLTPRAGDGRPTVRITTANRTKNFRLKVFSFCPGDATTLMNKSSTFTNNTDVTMTCYNAEGSVTTDKDQAVKSIIDYEPTHDYEVIGGWIDVPTSVKGGTTGLWWISCIGVPDLPAAYGGSVQFVTGTNLEAVYTQKVVSDGRATQYLTYNATYHTNKLRWITLHPTGTNDRFQIYVETFVG
jgi:hypothetical protein